jgi:hypothetical protein
VVFVILIATFSYAGSLMGAINQVTTNEGAVGVGMLTGAGAGGVGGYEFGKLICNKLGLYD